MTKVLKFSTSTCKYCAITSPRVDEWAQEKGYEVEAVDAEHDERAKEYDIMSVPSLVIFEGEQPTIIIGAEKIMEHIFG